MSIYFAGIAVYFLIKSRDDIFSITMLYIISTMPGQQKYRCKRVLIRYHLLYINSGAKMILVCDYVYLKFSFFDDFNIYMHIN